MNRSRVLVDFAPPPRGSCRNWCKSSVWQHMCLLERLAVPAGRCGPTEPQRQGHRRSPLLYRHPCGDWLFGAMGHSAAKQGPAAWGKHGRLHCTLRPPSMDALCPRAPTHLLPLGGSSPIPLASLCWQTLCKPLSHPLPPHPRPCLPPASQGCHQHRELVQCSGSDFPRRCTLQVLRGCRTKSGSAAHPDR